TSQPTVAVQSVDPNAYATISPVQQSLGTNGSATYNITFQRANQSGWIVQASTVSGSAITTVSAGVTPPVVVIPTTTDRLQIILLNQTPVPGLTAGGANGLTGNPGPATAGG